MRPDRSLASRRSRDLPRGARPTAGLLAVCLGLTATPVAARAPAPAVLEAPQPGPVVEVEVGPDAPPALVAPITDPSLLDEVMLRDGSVVRGTIAEVFQGRRVTIVSATGQTHTFTWAQIAEFRHAGAANTPVAGPGRPLLHVELTRPAPVRLFEITNQYPLTPHMARGPHGAAQSAMPLCRAPCDLVVDGSRGQSFFFAGDGLTTSRHFTLDEHDGPMLARVRPGKSRVMLGGILLASLGVVPALSGALFTGLAGRADTTSSQQTFRAGLTMTAVGVGMLVSGIVMIALGRTRVELYRRYTGAAQRRGKH